MKTVDPSGKIDEVLKAHLAPFLKEGSFRRQGRHFWRDHGCVIDTLNLQKSSWNDKRKAKFCINLGLIWPKVDAKLKIDRKKSHPSADSSTVQIRLGKLLTGRDYWWSVTDETDTDSLRSEVLEAVQKHAIPWLENGHDPKVSIGYLVQVNRTLHVEALKKLYRL